LMRKAHEPQLTQHLTDAADQGDLAAVSRLLAEHPGLVNSTNGNAHGSTPLHFAAHSGHADVIRVLLAHGANINARNNEGQTPLMIAADSSQTETVKLLLANHADANLKDNSSHTAWNYAGGGNFKHGAHLPEIEAMLKADMESHPELVLPTQPAKE
jgi:ankyrin repeat protein